MHRWMNYILLIFQCLVFFIYSFLCWKIIVLKEKEICNLIELALDYRYLISTCMIWDNLCNFSEPLLSHLLLGKNHTWCSLWHLSEILCERPWQREESVKVLLSPLSSILSSFFSLLSYYHVTACLISPTKCQVPWGKEQFLYSYQQLRLGSM